MFTRKCIVCNCDFFTEQEEQDYKMRHKKIPIMCSTCYQALQRKREVALVEIAERWNVEAKQESAKYFYYTDEVKQILSGSTAFVIGRKGEGKTAIAEYISEIQEPKIFTEKMSLKNFPFNILYGLSNDEYTAPNQYITIWKYIIYSNVCRLMIKNQNIDLEMREKLELIYGDTRSNRTLDRMIKKWTTKDFGIQILGNGVSMGRELSPNEELSWIEKTTILEDLIIEYIDDSSYFILFDELDEDYKEFSSESEKNIYTSLITSLFKAIQSIRGLCEDNDIRVWPIAFLRKDIFMSIRDSDKNKWSDSSINIVWDELKIKEMLTYRLSEVFNEKGSFDYLWKILFPISNITMGNKRAKKIEVFSYMVRSTQLRPRDFIKYMKVCADLTLRYHKSTITPDIVKEADGKFSEYLRGEIVDEIHVILPEIEDIFELFSQIRKQTFSPKEFEKAYNDRIVRKNLSNRSAEDILRMLFDVSAIGNQPTMKGQTIFKYEKDSARFNYKENIMIHRGLFKALQIF